MSDSSINHSVMKDLLAKIASFISDFRGRANAAIANLPPLDQLEVGGEVLSGLRCLKWAGEEINDAASRMEQIASGLETYVSEQITARIAAGELFDKDAHEGAVNAARQDERTKVEGEKDGEIAALRRMEGNRRAVASAVPAVIAAAVSDEILQLEDVAPVVNELTRRVTELGKVGLSADVADEAKKSAFTRKVFCAAFDESGARAFDQEVSDLVACGAKPAAAAPSGGVAAGAAPGSATPPVTTPGAATSESKRPGFAF